MTYRSDQDAALARADALQVDLDRSEAELARAKAQLARREAELAAARASKTVTAPPRPVAPPPRVNAPLIFGVSILGAAVLVGAVTFVRLRADAAHEEREREFQRSLRHADIGEGMFRDCTVHTVPSGARVVSVGGGEEYPMGTTPFTRSLGSWAIDGEHFEARLAGYEPVQLVEPPVDYARGPCETTLVLQPLSAR